MRKQSFLLVVSLFLFGVGVPAQTIRRLHVLHTSDTHSRIEPLDPHSSDNHAGMGGVARRAALVNQYRQQHPDVLLFDSGDFSQGTPFYNLFKGELEVKAMNLMGYDAVGIGNHEFDFGLDNMARIYKMAKFPVVCANYDVKGTVLEGLVKPYVVIKRKGLRIGVFGLSPKLEGLVQGKNYEGVAYLDPAASANRVVDILKNKKHCDVIICLSHLGMVQGDNITPEDWDNLVIPQTHGIDLVLGGHSHTYLKKPRAFQDADQKDVALMHDGKNGYYVGKVILTLEKKK